MTAMPPTPRRPPGVDADCGGNAGVRLLTRATVGVSTAGESGSIVVAGRISPSIPTNIEGRLPTAWARSHVPLTTVNGITAIWIRVAACGYSNSGADLPAARATVGALTTGSSGSTTAAGPISQSRAAAEAGIETATLVRIPNGAATLMPEARAQSSPAHRMTCIATTAQQIPEAGSSC